MCGQAEAEQHAGLPDEATVIPGSSFWGESGKLNSWHDLPSIQPSCPNINTALTTYYSLKTDVGCAAGASSRVSEKPATFCEFDPCCTLHEWLVFPPRGSTEFYADAAFSTLRAHAAKKPNLHNGLFADFRCGCTRNQREIGRRATAERTKPPFRYRDGCVCFCETVCRYGRQLS